MFDSKPVRSAATLIVLAIVISACAIFPGSRRKADVAAATPDSIRVFVLNENYYDARIHAVFDGARKSMGTVPGNGGRAVVSLGWEPRGLTFDVQFVTEGTRYLTYPLDLSPGDSIELRLPLNISASGAFRRVR